MPKINSSSRQRGRVSVGGSHLRTRLFLDQKREMVVLFFCVLLAAFVVTGCTKHEAAVNGEAVPTDGQAAAPAPASPRGPPGMTREAPPAVVADSGDLNATLHDLSLELRKYVVRTRSVPKTFEEFAAKSRVQMPPAPAGKKYAIQGQAVVLVKN